MKTLFLLLFNIPTLAVFSQTFHATVSDGAFYFADTTKSGESFGKDHNIIIHNFHAGAWFDAEYQGQKVFVKAVYIDKTDDFREYFHKLVVQPMLDSLNKARPYSFDNYKNGLMKKYGLKYATDILNAQIKIGQPKEVVIEIIGQPDDVNRTVTAKHVYEQFIYRIKNTGKAKYFYFNNGILTSFQD